MPYLKVTQDYEKNSGKKTGFVNLEEGEIVFAEEYNPQMKDTRIHSFILDAKFYVPTSIITPVIPTDEEVVTMQQRELEAYNKKLEYLKGKSQFTTPVTATADGGDDANAADGGDDGRASNNVRAWLMENKMAGGKKKRTRRNKRVKSRRRIKGKSVRRSRK